MNNSVVRQGFSEAACESEDPYCEIGFHSGAAIEGYVEDNYEVGRKGSGPGQFGGWIQHFAVSHDGKVLYACDSWNKRIQAINLINKKPLHTFPSHMVDFSFQPRGIAVLRNGNLCVNCIGFDGRSQIGIFTPEGRMVSRFGDKVIGSSSAMAVDEEDRIVVMDRRKMRITTMATNGQVLQSFDPFIEGDVVRIACDSRGRIVVPDHLNNAVMVYDTIGRPVSKIHPAIGTGYDFRYPAGVACDVNDNILVCDVGNHRVTQFSREGVYRATVLNKKDHGLWRPHDIVATSQGNVLLNEVSGTFLKIFCFAPSGN